MQAKAVKNDRNLTSFVNGRIICGVGHLMWLTLKH